MTITNQAARRRTRRGQPGHGVPPWQLTSIDRATARPADRAPQAGPLRQSVRRALTVLALVPLTRDPGGQGRPARHPGAGQHLRHRRARLDDRRSSTSRSATTAIRPTDAAALTARPLVSCLVAVRDDVDLIERVPALAARAELRQRRGHRRRRPLDRRHPRTAHPAGSRAADQVLLLEANVGKKRALDPGGRRTRTGDYFVFTDSDCVLDRLGASSGACSPSRPTRASAR